MQPTPIEIPLLSIPEEVERTQIKKLKELRRERDNQLADKALKRLKKGAETDQNLIPLLVECAKTYCTLGEMVDTLKDVFGEYDEPDFI